MHILVVEDNEGVQSTLVEWITEKFKMVHVLNWFEFSNHQVVPQPLHPESIAIIQCQKTSEIEAVYHACVDVENQQVLAFTAAILDFNLETNNVDGATLGKLLKKRNPYIYQIAYTGKFSLDTVRSVLLSGADFIAEKSSIDLPSELELEMLRRLDYAMRREESYLAPLFETEE